MASPITSMFLSTALRRQRFSANSLNSLGSLPKNESISSTAVNMFFKKVVQTKAIPFEISVANEQKKSTYDMSKEELKNLIFIKIRLVLLFGVPEEIRTLAIKSNRP